MPREVKELVDRLGQMFVQALVTDEGGRDVLKQIQEHGFEVGILVEATVALHSRRSDAQDDAETQDFLRGLLGKAERSETGFDWSEEDRAMLCNFRISLD